MYSKEDREWALYVYEECGNSASKAAKIMDNVISRRTIRRWAEEARSGEARSRKTSVYLPYAKKLILLDRLQAGEEARALAEEADIATETLLSWRRKTLEHERPSLMTRDERFDKASADLPEPSDEIEELRRRNYELELDNAILEQTIEILKKDPGVDPAALSNAEKARVIDALRNRFPLKRLLVHMACARSTYFYQRNAVARPDKRAGLRRRVAEIFAEREARWGSERIWAQLRRDGTRVSEKVVRKMMRELSLQVVYVKRRRAWSSYAGEVSRHPGNSVCRDFHADAPNVLWLTDITQFTLPGFKCYLSPVIDCFDGKVIAHKVSLSPDSTLADSMLDDAAASLAPGQHPICHSDCGVHYRTHSWIERCRKYSIMRSMSGKGCSPDNSAAEGFFGRLKNEFFYHRNWDGILFEDFSSMLGDYIQWYNECRFKKSLGWLSPNEYRRSRGLAA